MDKRAIGSCACPASKTQISSRTLLVNVFSGAVEATDIAIAGERLPASGRATPGCRNRPGGPLCSARLIGAHVHIESSLCIPRSLPGRFCRAG